MAKKIRKSIYSLLVAGVVISTMISPMYAAEDAVGQLVAEEVQDIDAPVEENGFVVKDGVLLEYKGDEVEVEVPANIKGQTITAIGDYAFKKKKFIEKIVLPETIEKLGVGSFYMCEKVEFINIPSKVEEIPKYCFDDCYNLKTLLLHDNIKKIGSGSFYGCGKLEDLHIPKNLKVIESTAFAYANLPKEVVLEEGLEKLAHAAFSSCKGVERLVIPSTVKWEYYEYESYLPKVVNVLNGYNSIKEVEIDAEVVPCRFASSSNVEKVIIGNHVKTIEQYAFNNCRLKEVIFKNENSQLETIEEYAFEDNYGLQKLVFPDSLKKIEYGAFSSCGQLTDVKFNEGLEEIGKNAFIWSSKLKELVLPKSIKYIGSGAFHMLGYDEVRGRRIIVPSTDVNIETSSWYYSREAFEELVMPINCKNLIEIPAKSVTMIFPEEYNFDELGYDEWLEAAHNVISFRGTIPETGKGFDDFVEYGYIQQGDKIKCVKPLGSGRLAELEVKGYTLNKAFDKEQLVYQVSVPYIESSVEVLAKGASDDVEVVISGADELKVGSNTVTVTSTNKITKESITYTIYVTRAEAPLSSNTEIKEVLVNGKAATGADYFVELENKETIADVKVTTVENAKVEVERNPEFGGEGMNLEVGDNAFIIKVTAEDGTQEQYTLIVRRAQVILSDDAELKGISINGEEIADFDSKTTSYDMEVENDVTSINVNVEKPVGATVDIQGDGELQVGSNKISIIVTAEDGTQNTYTINVERKEEQEQQEDKYVNVDVDVNTSHNYNAIGQQYYVTIKANTAIDLSKLHIVFNADGIEEGSKFWCDNAGVNVLSDPWYIDLTGSVNGTITNGCVDIVIDKATSINQEELTFTIQVRFNKEDWSQYSEITNENIVVYYDGE